MGSLQLLSGMLSETLLPVKMKRRIGFPQMKNRFLGHFVGYGSSEAKTINFELIRTHTFYVGHDTFFAIITIRTTKHV